MGLAEYCFINCSKVSWREPGNVLFGIPLPESNQTASKTYESPPGPGEQLVTLLGKREEGKREEVVINPYRGQRSSCSEQ